MTRLTVDVQEVETGIISVLETTIREPLTILTFLAAMFFISPLLTLFVLFVLPMSGFIIGRIGKTLKKKSHLAQQQLGIILSIIDETLSGLRIVKGFNAEKTLSAKFSQQNQNHYDIQMSMILHKASMVFCSIFFKILVRFRP